MDPSSEAIREFSVVITTKNRIEFLDRAVNSILFSKIRPSEIIIVNDGGEIIKGDRYDCADVKIHFLQFEQSKGANVARNKGIMSAHNEIVFLLDDDDAVDRDSLGRRYEILANNSNIGLCYTGIKIVSSLDLSFVIRRVYPADSENYEKTLLVKGNIVGSTSRVAIKKEPFRKAGMFDEDLKCFQDFDLWLRMSRVCDFAHDGACGVFYTIHQNSRQVSSQFGKYLEASSYLEKKYQDRCQEYSCRNQFVSNLLFRVCLSSASSSKMNTMKYAFLSLLYSPNLKALAILVLPYGLIKRMRTFV